MRISGRYDRKLADSFLARAFSRIEPVCRLLGTCRLLRTSFAVAWLCCPVTHPIVLAQEPYWPLKPIEAQFDTASAHLAPSNFGLSETRAREKPNSFSLSSAAADNHRQTIDRTIAPAEFAQPMTDEPIPRPAYLDIEDQMPRPSFLDPNNQEFSITDQIERLNQRINELETSRVADEDATRSIIRQSFAERASNITDTVTFGGTLETLTFWQDDFDGVSESNIVLDTAELDFDIQMNTWSRASLYLQYFQGDDFLFPTSEGDEVGVDRITVRRGIITIGDTTRYPLFITSGRDVVPFGISTGDPVTDVLTINDPLTVEVFETREDFFLIGFELPVPPLPPAVSPYSAPAPLPPRPILFNPLARALVSSICPYCGPLDTPRAPAAYAPPPCLAPYTGAIYFYNGNTLEGLNDSNQIEQMGGTLGYRTRGAFANGCIPWNLDCDVDVNSSVFDSNFLQFQYRHFLDQIGFVPGMAAHVKSSVGPFGFVVEWNGAISPARFTDDAATPISITPSAWQVALNYQFDWNPSVEVIGAQGTYLALGYSESQDLGGVIRIVDPAVPVPTRIGFVPEKRLSVGIGEWVLDGLRIGIEYSHIIDYGTDEGGTGNSANGYFMQMTYEW